MEAMEGVIAAAENRTIKQTAEAGPPPETRKHEKYERLIARAKELPPKATIVAHPCDESSLRGAIEAAEAGLIVPTLVGPEARIRAAASPSDLTRRSR